MGVKEEQNGQYVSAECPMRTHRTARVRFWCGDTGKLVFRCMACPEQLEILRAVGATWPMCFPEDVDWKRVKGEIVAKYHYRDEAGHLLYTTCRVEPGYGGKDKSFFQRRRCPETNGWVNSLGDARRVLYRLPELLHPGNRDKTVYLVAGEKDVESLRTVGLLATTNVCGERAEWLDEYSAALAGRDVVVVQDADDVGRRHVNEVCGSLMGHARSVRRVVLEKKDATALLMHYRSEGVEAKRELRELFEGAVLAAEGRTWAPVRNVSNAAE
jgi:5S rRNA maturation endonuclease (ribonuclease M5)